jgi:hypothetical protein
MSSSPATVTTVTPLATLDATLNGAVTA